MSLSHNSFEQPTNPVDRTSCTEVSPEFLEQNRLTAANEVFLKEKMKNHIPSEEIVKKDIIGSGSYGTVYKGTWNLLTVAIKELAHTISTEKEKNFLEKLTEMKAPNIIKFLGYSIDAKYQIITEYMPKKALSHFIDNCFEAIPIKLTYSFMIDIVTAVNFLHQQKILHRDIKSSNVLLDEDHRAYLADFGCAIYEDEKQDHSIGTLDYMAPEVLLKQPATKASDIYSTAIVFWEITSRKAPYTDIKERDFTEKVAIKNYREPTYYCKSDLGKVIEEAWHPEPKKRPTTGELLVRLHLLATNNNVNLTANNNAEKSVGMALKN